jgi:lipopolysaccharide transport system ATP-binding protein
MRGSRKPEKDLRMSSDGIAIRVRNVSKCYPVYAKPRDRLMQFVAPRLQRWMGQEPRQYFREFWALKDVSFKIKKGETVGIIGRNGSGKSTLLQIICGTLYPSAGDIEVHGRVAALLELGSGFNPDFSGRENVYLNASLLGLRNKQIDARFDAIAAFADIGEFIERPVKTYSSGMLLRLAFAVIAHVDADILVIDEALGVGDVYFVQKCMRFLRDFMRRGTVLFVSHDTGAIVNLCRTAVWLHGGQMQAHGAPKAVTEKYLEKYYESLQGPALAPAPGASVSPPASAALPHDTRAAIAGGFGHPGVVELFSFNPDAAGFGKGGIIIETAALYDGAGKPVSWSGGGEQLSLRIHCRAVQDVFSPIVGFMVKDRLGQVVFAENTHRVYATRPLELTAGDRFSAQFDFVMPVMPTGNYTVAVAVAEGTESEHVQHHWIHDAIVIKVHSSQVCHGLVGIPMTGIDLSKS